MTAALPVASPAGLRGYARGVVRRFAGRFTAVVLLNLAAAGAALAVPNLLGRMTGLIAGGGPGLAGRLGTLTVAVGAALLVQTGLAWQAARVTYALGERVVALLREDFLDRVAALPLSIVERAGTGDLTARTTLDTAQVSTSVRYAVPQFFVNLVTMVVVLAGALWVSPLLAVTALVAVPLLAAVVRWYLRRAPAAFAAVQARLADLTTSVAQTADGAHTVEALGWQGRRIADTDREIARTWAAQRRTLTLRAVLFPALDLTVLLPCLTTLVLGGVLVARGRADIGEVTTVALLMQMLAAPAVELVRSLEGLQMGAASLARLVGVHPDPGAPGARPGDQRDRAGPGRRSTVGTGPDVPLRRGGSATLALPHAVIRLAGVHFGYTPDREVLHGVDLTLHRGERLALVGPTGAGKSTLARILAGIHPPDRGSVTTGGVPFGDLAPGRLRRLVLLTTQEQHVFAGTLADNLRLARPDATDADLAAALSTVDALDWADALPRGPATPLDGGVRLSAARAQQIALARLLLAAPEVVILDEATSMLSPGAARAVEAALNRVLTGRTVVAIAHRLHTAHDADRIAVMDQGRIVQVGTHARLVTEDGAYRRLWTRWHDGATEPADRPTDRQGGAR